MLAVAHWQTQNASGDKLALRHGLPLGGVDVCEEQVPGLTGTSSPSEQQPHLSLDTAIELITPKLSSQIVETPSRPGRAASRDHSFHYGLMTPSPDVPASIPAIH